MGPATREALESDRNHPHLTLDLTHTPTESLARNENPDTLQKQPVPDREVNHRDHRSRSHSPSHLNRTAILRTLHTQRTNETHPQICPDTHIYAQPHHPHHNPSQTLESQPKPHPHRHETLPDDPTKSATLLLTIVQSRASPRMRFAFTGTGNLRWSQELRRLSGVRASMRSSLQPLAVSLPSLPTLPLPSILNLRSRFPLH